MREEYWQQIEARQNAGKDKMRVAHQAEVDRLKAEKDLNDALQGTTRIQMRGNLRADLELSGKSGETVHIGKRKDDHHPGVLNIPVNPK